MKTIALLMVAIFAPSFVFANSQLSFTKYEDSLLSNNYLQTDDAFNKTAPKAYERIRAQDFKPTVFENTGENKIYQKNVGENMLQNLPGVEHGRECLHWKTCVKRTFWKTNGFENSYAKRFIRNVQVQYDMAMNRGNTEQANNRSTAPKDNEFSGKSKLKRLRKVEYGYRGM